MRLGRVLFLGVLVVATFLAVCPSRFPWVSAKDRERSALAQPEPSAPTLKVYSRETYVDVSVTDKQGNAVHGLTRDDFTILEDGQPVSPNSFAEYGAAETAAGAAAAPAPRPALPANTFTNFDPDDGKGPINILLFDSSNLPVMTQHIVQTQMLDFMERMRPGTRAAVLRMTYHLSILQGVTTDRDLIRAAVKSDKITPGDFALEDAIQDVAHSDDPASVVPDASDVAGLRPDDGARIDIDHARARGDYTDAAMKQLARFLEGMPGRKNLIWFTGFTPHLNVVSDADLLSRGHVSIYPIDPRGPESRPSRLGRVEDAAMQAMAEQTGGRMYGHNDMANSVLHILDNASNYYAFTYIPTEHAATSGNFRNITVKVDRPGVTLTYRPGYYATDPARSLTNMKLPPQPTAMQAAMERGGLEPTQILFRVHVAPLPAVDSTLPDANQADPKRMKPLFRHLAVSYSIALDGISFDRTGDGKYRSDFELGVMVYNSDGQLINTVSKHVRPVVSQAAYESMLKDGAEAHEEIAVPAKGDYFLRIGVHDLTTDHVGALEVPTSAIAPGPTSALAVGQPSPAR